jgi:membrane-associated protease RseP (regulator of RpoE activity)
MRRRLQRLIFAPALFLLVNCANHTWAPGPGMAAANFEPDSAQCRLFARGSNPQHSYDAYGSPKFVAASMAGMILADAIGDAVRSNENFNDCMQAHGWRVADNAKPPPVVATPPATAPIASTAAAMNTAIPAGGVGQSSAPAAPNAPSRPRRELGIRAALVSTSLAYSTQIHPPHGLIVTKIMGGGAASSAGMLPGDVIFTIGGAPVSSLDDIQRALAGVAPATTVSSDVWRNGQQFSLALRF